MGRDRENLVAGAAVLGIAALLFTQVLPGRFEGVDLARNPMSVPRVLLLIFAAGGALLVLRGLIGPGAAVPGRRVVAWRRVLVVILLAGAYFALFAPIGFLPATLVFLPVMMLVLGYRNAPVLAAVTLLGTVGLWYLFADGFSVRPPGIGIDELVHRLRAPS